MVGLTGVRFMGADGVPVASGVASACARGQGCRVTENNEQFAGSEQIFR